ncbi:MULTISPECIES: hypothetical protein [unclassified Tessaracoccus]|uniref:hypothetical protein n=1 Tax=unclassified Tessaracoccus TaxID=2635419 RepID=UPI00160320F1|nr:MULTISPECIES: hypothetical protein [unclassified Tessaracoccus]MBB1511359.1 hypothetical protein [Tessaracoccus sp. MC1627]MBB1514937.1 hypothetical protein [Tessaracoccus sp. MC1679]
MTQMVLAVLGGLAVAALVVVLIVRAAKGGDSQGGSTGFGWAALGLGVLTLILAAVGYAFAPDFASEAEAAAASGEFDSQSLYMVGTVTGIAAAATAGLALKRGDRGWPTWTGLLIGAAVIGAWVYVIIYVMFNPY